MAIFKLKINGTIQSIEATEDTPLLWALRDQLDMVGTKFGCGIGQCGACTVHVDGNATRSCLLTISQLDGKEITTIEGLSEDGSHPVQEAWKEVDVPQCGYCQAGQLMNAAALLSNNRRPSDEQIDHAMEGNLCRCATYPKIKEAIKTAAKNI